MRPSIRRVRLASPSPPRPANLGCQGQYMTVDIDADGGHAEAKSEPKGGRRRQRERCVSSSPEGKLALQVLEARLLVSAQPVLRDHDTRSATRLVRTLTQPSSRHCSKQGRGEGGEGTSQRELNRSSPPTRQRPAAARAKREMKEAHASSDQGTHDGSKHDRKATSFLERNPKQTKKDENPNEDHPSSYPDSLDRLSRTC